ncbi:hypothetical protein [Desulfurobacterium sp.]
MYSESDFNKFKNKVIERAQEVAKEKIESAKSFAGEKLIEAEREGRALYQEKVKAARIELEAFKFDAMAEIDSKVRKTIEDREIQVREELLKELKSRLKERFPEMVECFIRWIKNNFSDGTFETHPTLKKEIEKLAGANFSVKENAEINGVVFKHGRMVIEFSLESILEEFKEEIDREIASILEV